MLQDYKVLIQDTNDTNALQAYLLHARDTIGAREARLRLIFGRIGMSANKTLDVDNAVLIYQATINDSVESDVWTPLNLRNDTVVL